MTDEFSEAPETASAQAEDKPKSAKKAARKSVRKRTAKKAPKAEGQVPGETASAPETQAPVRSEEPQTDAQRGAKSEASEARDERNPSERRPDDRHQRDAHSDQDDRSAVMGEPPSADEHGSGKRRKRRRRRGGSGGEEKGEERQHEHRSKLDPDMVAKRAWKIFLAEVSEEGLALISDNDARELSRRSFRLAEVFLEEANRHQ